MNPIRRTILAASSTVQYEVMRPVMAAPHYFVEGGSGPAILRCLKGAVFAPATGGNFIPYPSEIGRLESPTLRWPFGRCRFVWLAKRLKRAGFERVRMARP